MIPATSIILPFVTSLNGISSFTELNERSSAIKTSKSALLTVVFLSLHDELRIRFSERIDVHIFRKNSGDMVFIHESQIFRYRKNIELALKEEGKFFVFDGVSRFESLALLVRVLEKGHQAIVFCPWIYRKEERRSAFSILFRDCVSKDSAMSQGERAMWTSYALPRVWALEVKQIIEFV